MGLKWPRLGGESGLRTCSLDFGMHQLQSFGIPFDSGPDHPRVAQVGKAPDSVQPKQETALGREGAPESLNQRWNGAGVNFSQELQSEVDVLNGCPVYIGSRIPKRLLQLVEQFLTIIGYGYGDERPHDSPDAGSKNRRRQARAKKAARSRIDSRSPGMIRRKWMVRSLPERPT